MNIIIYLIHSILHYSRALLTKGEGVGWLEMGMLFIFYIYNTFILNIFYIRLQRGGEVQGGGWNLPAEGIKCPLGLTNEGGEVLGGQGWAWRGEGPPQHREEGQRG